MATNLDAQVALNTENIAKRPLRNLLDNPWFTINQRGTGSRALGAGFTSDRWRTHSNYVYATLSNDGGITLNPSTTLTGSAWIIRQDMEASRFDSTGTYTLGFDVVATNIYRCEVSVSFRNSSDSEIISEVTPLRSGINTVTFNGIPSGTTIVRVGIYYYGSDAGGSIGTSTQITIRKTKLELGSASTLAYDIEPNYVDELRRCQRYFVNMKHQMFHISYAYSTSHVLTVGKLPVPMRQTPSYVGSAIAWAYNVNGGVATATDFGYSSSSTNEFVYMTYRFDSAIVMGGNQTFVFNTQAFFSADL